MSVAIKTGEPRLAPNSSREGDGVDLCPEDGCMEVEQIHHLGGVDNHGEDHHLWSMFSADRRQGGCGATWTRTTKEGQSYDHKRGINPQRLSHSAEVDRSYSLASDLYQERWEQIDWSK